MALRIPVFLFLVIILSACGTVSAPSTSLRLTMTDFAFLPNTLTVPAGQEITISVTNSGAVAHDFRILKLGYKFSSSGQVGDEGHANTYWEQELLGPGSTMDVRLMAPSEPGEYQIVCGVAGHLQAGMVGKLVVVAAR